LPETPLKNHGSATEIGQEFKVCCNFKSESVDLETELPLFRYMLTLL